MERPDLTHYTSPVQTPERGRRKYEKIGHINCIAEKGIQDNTCPPGSIGFLGGATRDGIEGSEEGEAYHVR